MSFKKEQVNFLDEKCEFMRGFKIYSDVGY